MAPRWVFFSSSSRSSSVLTVTSNALLRLKELYRTGVAPANSVLRISVVAKGCSGSGYDLKFVASCNPGDEVVKVDENISLSIDSKALLAVIGSEMDFRSDDLSSEFVFSNPNVESFCGCGSSFSVASAKRD